MSYLGSGTETLTGGGHGRLSVSRRELPLARYFDAAAFSCDTGFEKLAKEANLAALDRLKSSPGDAVYVGDDGNGELKGARETGFRAVVFMRGNVATDGLRTPEEVRHFERVADNIIDSIGELPDLIGRIGRGGPGGGP